jgi:hypothetical protein
MQVQYYVRYVYGKPLMYLTGNAAGAIHQLTHRRTVDAADLEALKELGHAVMQVVDPGPSVVSKK